MNAYTNKMLERLPTDEWIYWVSREVYGEKERAHNAGWFGYSGISRTKQIEYRNREAALWEAVIELDELNRERMWQHCGGSYWVNTRPIGE
jgi:hypothetical protein